MCPGIRDELHHREWPGRRDDLRRPCSSRRGDVMRRGARLVLVVAIAIAVVFALTACAQGDPTVSPGYVSGDGTVTVFDPPGDIVELTGEDFAGNQVDVSAFRGTVVLLNTWYAS